MLILDEPTVGLDPKQIIDIRNLIARLGKNHTIILSSHILSEIQAICDRIIIINQGEIIADDTLDSLSSKLSGEYSITARIICDEEDMLKSLKLVKGVKSVASLGKKESGAYDFEIVPEKDADIRECIFQKIVEKGNTMLSFASNAMSLERIFLRLTEVSDNQEARRMLGTDIEAVEAAQPQNAEITEEKEDEAI